MSKRLGLLIVMMLFVSLMTGCFGSDDDSTSTTPATAASVVITGSIPALSAPAGAPNYMVAYGTNYEMGVYNAATMTEITGSAVVITGTTYSATVAAGTANVTAVIVIKHKTTGKIVYSALVGILPTSTAMSAGSVTKVTVSGVNLTSESTAVATLARDKGIAASSVPVTSTSVTTMSASIKTVIEGAVTAATLTAVTSAVNSVQIAINAPGVTNTSILSALGTTLNSVLSAFVEAVKVASAAITSGQGATTVTVGGQVLTGTSTTTDVNSAVNGVTVVTITAVTNPADITVASGTAVSAITFPTTVSVTKSNGTTATASVVWSTVSVPAYVAATSGTYVFTGTVDGTTLTAKVNVIVGAAAQTVATPTFSPAAGTFTAAQSVTIATTTTGASIYYTIDGTTPTTASTAYTTAINVAATTTIKAIAVKTGMTNSAVASALYTVNISLIPVISAERAVKQANGDVVVTWTTDIVTPTAAKVIIRGSVPTPSDPSATETASTTTSHTVTVPAASFPSSYDKLVISYIIGEDGTSKEILKAAIIEAASVVADPAISPAAGTYTAAQSVTITCATTGASIYYTVDGTTPTSASTLYSAAFNVSASATVKAIATATSMTDSNVVSAAYVINIAPVTKVVTSLAIAKATDTVEASVAYTMPAATATYDDATTATVTASWFEGATAVTSPVTKTTAGTYTFTAKYTEGTVEVTAADFTLVVTEAVPVKTLDSLTVVATPTAPTCLVGGTTSVALVVTANYLTGTATSEAVVTTYTTGTNWANGVFTAATTVAGTENIVVSYTEGGVTKTANVAVTVSAEAPVVTTVTVTLPTTMTEASSTQAVVLVQDQFGATMTTGFTTAYATTTGTSTVSNTGLVTAGSYSTTASENAHVLTVTVTPTTGTAVTATTNFTVTADTTKPTIVSVSAIDNKNIVVTYDKKVSSTATTVANYSLYHGTTGITATLQAGAVNDANKEIKATALFTDSTNKIVKITLVDISAALGGYPAEGLDAVTYRLYVSNVADTTSSANTIIASSNTQFTGTTTPDSNKPVINAMAYNKGTGNLVITLDKAVVNALTYTYIKFNGTVLTTAVTNNAQTSGEENKISVTLASADKTTVAALTGDLTVTILADGIADANGNKNIETSMVASLTVPPAMSSAAYDEATNTLTMVFSQTLDLSTSTLRDAFKTSTNIQLKSTEMTAFALDANDSVLTSSNAATVSVLLSNTNAGKVEAVTLHTSPKVLVAATIFKNTNGDYNLKQDDSTTDYPAVTLTITKDSTKPAITSITYNETTKLLVLTFNAAVSRTFTTTNVTFFTSKDDSALNKSLTGLTPTEVTDGTTLTYNLGTNDPNGVAAAFKAVDQGSTTADVDKYYVYAKVSADTFTKVGSTLKNDAVTTKVAATTLTYTDNVGPYIDGAITVTNKVTISFTYNEKVNKTDAETLANYKVWLMSGSTKVSPLTLNSVTMTDSTNASPAAYTKKTVQIVTASQTDNASYLLEVLNVKDLTGNAISTTDAALYSKSFTGSTTAAPAPKPVSAKIRDNGNQSLDTSDYIAVTFDRPVKINTGAASTEYVNLCFDLNGAADFPATYAKSYVTMSTDTADGDKVVLIKVDSAMVTGGAALVVGTTTIDYITHGTSQATENIVWDKYSNVHANANGTPVTVESALGATTITEALLTDVDASGTVNKGDTLKVTFSNPMYVVAGTIAATDVDLATNNNLGTGATISTTMTTSVGSDNLTVTLGESPTFTPADIKAGNNVSITDQFLKDSWGIKVASTVVKAITTATVAAPYITKAEWVDVDGLGAGNSGDYVYVTFNVPVYLNSANTAAMWLANGAVLGAAPTVTKVTSDPKVLRVQLGGDTTLTPTVTTWEIDPAVVLSNITNFSGDKAVTAVTAGATTQKITINSDTTAPTITSVEFISENKLKVVFSEAVNVSNYVANKLQVSATTNISAAALDTSDTTGKTAILTLAANASIAEQSNGIASTTTTGLNILAGSKITDIAGNSLAATAAGASYIVIAKDATAPDATILAYELATKIGQLTFNNTANKVTVITNNIAYGELALLQVYTGASTPAADATPTGIQSAYIVNGVVGDVITGVTAATAGHKVFYRLLDRAGNKSAWLEQTTLAGLAAGTYKKVAATAPTTSGEANLSGDILSVGNGTTTVKYDLSTYATAKELMTDLAVNDTFTVDSSSLINAFTNVNAGAVDIALTAADLASTVTVTGDDAANALTLSGAATGKTIVLAAATGSYVVNATGITTLNISGASAGATISQAVTNVNVSAAITTLTVNATVTTMNVTAAIGTITSAGAGVVTTLTMGSAAGAFTANTGAANLTFTNIDQSATAADVAINLGNMTTTVTSLKGHATNKSTMTTTAAATLNVVSGYVDLQACAASTLNVAATGTTKVNATGRTLAAVAGAQTIEIAGATAATVSGAVTTLTVSAAVTTLNIQALVTTLNVNAGSTAIVCNGSASTTNIVLGDYAGNTISSAVATITVNASAVATAGRTVPITATAALAADLVVTQATSATATATADVPNPAAAVGNGIATWNIVSSAAAGATTQYTTTNGAATIKLNPIANGVTVTLTKN